MTDCSELWRTNPPPYASSSTRHLLLVCERWFPIYERPSARTIHPKFIIIININSPFLSDSFLSLFF